MAITLEYSLDRGSTWTQLTEYVHPTSAGVHLKHVKVGSIFETTDNTVRFRLTGTDAANWGLMGWAFKTPTTVPKDRDNV